MERVLWVARKKGNIADKPLIRLSALRSDMQRKEKAVTVFRISYEQQNYFVAVCLLTGKEKEAQRKEREYDKKDGKLRYALVRLCFMHADDIGNLLECYANTANIMAGMTELRNFLGVEYQENGIEWKKEFLSNLGKHISENAPENLSEEEKMAVKRIICCHENQNPDRIYPYRISRNGRKNGVQQYRSEYNGQLAAECFPILYPRFKADKEISFGFTDDLRKERTEAEILESFERNEMKRRQRTGGMAR